MPTKYLGKDVKIKSEKDIVRVRNAVYKVCENLGMSTFNRTKIATAASELARNIVEHAGEGRIIIIPLVTGQEGIQIIARDSGPGIDKDKLHDIFLGNYQSETGMGMGLYGAKKLSDEFDIDSGADGTDVRMTKYK